jgi:hypothetical protein
MSLADNVILVLAGIALAIALAELRDLVRNR